ncbi:DUF2252 family protein [Streptomyces sp. ZYX-F-203]
MPVPEFRDERRGEEILAVFATAFGGLPAGRAAVGARFRAMAASPLAFHRGSACLSSHDLAADPEGGRYLDERTSRGWIHGDLHAGNFGARLDGTGRLVFQATGLDDAYVGPFTWDLKRFVASLALLGHARALSDARIADVVRGYAHAYRERVHALATGAEGHETAAPTTETARGPLLDTLLSARSRTRSALLDSLTEVRGAERRFRPCDDTVELDAATRYKVLAAFDGYLETLPDTSLSRPDAYRVKDVVGRRHSAEDEPSTHHLLVEGGSDALEHDVVVEIRRIGPPAVARHLAEPALDAHFAHEGHRAVVARRALMPYADPWLGWTELDGEGRLVREVSPYAVDLDWDRVMEPSEVADVAADLGRVTATTHAASAVPADGSVVPFPTGRAIDAAIAADEDGFAPLLVDHARASAERALEDHRIFVDLLRRGMIPGL